jgi:DNA-binding protein H-NS
MFTFKFVLTNPGDGKMKINIERMSVDELWSLHQQICSLLASKMSAEISQLETRLSQLTMASPSTDKAARRPYPPVVPKFRNPVRPSETWAGRGKQPRWMTAQLRSGKKLDDFRIRAS